MRRINNQIFPEAQGGKLCVTVALEARACVTSLACTLELTGTCLGAGGAVVTGVGRARVDFRAGATVTREAFVAFAYTRCDPTRT